MVVISLHSVVVCGGSVIFLQQWHIIMLNARINSLHCNLHCVVVVATFSSRNACGGCYIVACTVWWCMVVVCVAAPDAKVCFLALLAHNIFTVGPGSTCTICTATCARK